MRWTQQQLLNHPRYKQLTAQDKLKQQPKQQSEQQPKRRLENKITFIVPGVSIGKPRMTQRDRWKKRPIVLRYQEYCDRLRQHAPVNVLNADALGIKIVFYRSMPAWWSKKKQQAFNGKLCRVEPDWDNLAKAVCDALFKEDAGIAIAQVVKLWCFQGNERTEVTLYFSECAEEQRRFTVLS
jgi:Holliday junction resolvase RusA-like endonuclease